MAKGGGGSWKVAYADFVTAMMAFFLVMWIGAQDVKVRQSVANYFVDPSGVSKRPANQGAVLDAPVSGPVAADTKVDGGRGVRQPGGDTPSPTTKAVLDWVNSDEKHWKAEAARCRQVAVTIQVVQPTRSIEDITVDQLSQSLKSELTGSIPSGAAAVHKELLFGSFKDVNWEQVAKVLLRD